MTHFVEIGELEDGGRRWVGIDPGMDGYVAALTERGGVYLEAAPVVKTGKGNKRRYNVPAMHQLVLAVTEGAELVLIERQQAMVRSGGGQGAASAFKTGFGYGLWIMALAAACVPHEEIQSASWKRKMGISSSKTGLDHNARTKLAKALAVEKCQQLYPNVSLIRPRCRVPSPDMAEALLLARFARHKFLGLPL